MRLHAGLVLAALFLAACGEDAPPPPPPRAAPPPGPGAPPPPGRPGPAPVGGQLQPRLQIEQKITCTSPEKPTGPKCNPSAPDCEAELYCLPTAGAHHCEPCPERDSIRHEFKDRDFVADQVRDPFQSFVIVQPGLIEEPEQKIEGPCNRAEQFVASNYSYLDLRLVGIVSQGTQRKVLMMDRGNLGHIIRRGDCVGKEKALVKEIGTGYVTFVIAPDPNDRASAGRPPEERSMQLHPKGLQVPTSQPTPESAAPTAPIVAPPGAGATQPTGAGTQTGTGVTITRPATGTQPAPQPAPQAPPTNVSP